MDAHPGIFMRVNERCQRTSLWHGHEGEQGGPPQRVPDHSRLPYFGAAARRLLGAVDRIALRLIFRTGTT